MLVPEDGCSYIPRVQWEEVENSLGSKRSTGDLERRRGNSFSPVFSPHSAGHHYPYSYLSQAARNQKIC